MDDRGDQNAEPDSNGASSDGPTPARTGRFSISPRMTSLLIGGAALGLIVLMCLVVALVAALQSS